MCGIIAYTGSLDAVSLLVGGLERLEYRGYDSAGIALVHAEGLEVIRRSGRVSELKAAIDAIGPCGTTGIGHTRWATHGVPCERNAHPHCDCDERIAVVHNGTIENYALMRDMLAAEGHQLASETDTEVVAHLVEREYARIVGDAKAVEHALAATPTPAAEAFVQAVRNAARQLVGSFALAVVHHGHPGLIVVTRSDSPLVIGSCPTGALAASEPSAIIEHTRDIVHLNDHDVAALHSDGTLVCYDAQGTEYLPSSVHVDWDIENAQRGGYADFFLKEINEQPRVLRETVAEWLDAVSGMPCFKELLVEGDELRTFDRLCVVACGTSYHVGLIGRYLFESWARMPADVEIASEFRYRDPVITPKTLVIGISQSGETADTLEAVRVARARGAYVLAITNTVGSRITVEANATLYIKANLEISVAATKSFLAQTALITLIALFLGQRRGTVTEEFARGVCADLLALPDTLQGLLGDEHVLGAIESCARECRNASTALFIGRGVGATTCYEGALKLKEISYLHAEAYSAGEIKHGPIALIDPAGLTDAEVQTPVVALVLQSSTYEKMITNIAEVCSRGAKVIALATEGDERIAEFTDHVIFLPPVRECLSPLLASVPLQLFAHAIAVERGCDVDHPRNLAKSVTVE
ncbi:MAG: glutamine--fructose-6-phosphate transaminase (isomerizing) [Coriobacteriales bacterium]|jgi:glucosamine--fructose-6-phosphate aminotransferase (isomerizing)|nr:glutamine--fructose-6-phosphate transaminase (isomerizing) [Coriobacteriales bacterium]